ncbi:putative AC9 transposase [Bienertia sinuspersici]
MEIFRTYDGRVSLTSDTWTSTYGEPFLCVTARWIDDNWLLKKRIICFEAMEEAHNGFNIKTRIEKSNRLRYPHPMKFNIQVIARYHRFITYDHWSLAKIIHDALETFDKATHIFSYVYEPNVHMVILECIKVICTIEQTSLSNPNSSSQETT